MYDQGDAVIGKNIRSQSVPVDPFLDIRPCLLRVPRRGMDESMDGPICPGVAPSVRELLLKPSHKLNCPEIHLNVEPFIEVVQYPVVKRFKTD